MEHVVGTLMRWLLFLLGIGGAWGLWFGEIHWLKGWPGTAWLSGFTWSSFPICALLCLLCSYAVRPHVATSKRTAFVGASFAMAMCSFLLVRQAFFYLFSGGFPSGPAYRPMIELVIGWWILPLSLPFFANRWLGPIHRWAPVLIAGSLALAIPLSFLTIKIFPAVNGSTDQVHAFKMGYPVIWIAALLPSALSLARKHEATVLSDKNY